MFNFTAIQIFFFLSRQNSKTINISQTFLPLTVAKLSTLKTVRIFWPTLYIPHVGMYLNMDISYILKASCLHTCASVTKQNNLAPDKGQ